MSTTVETVINKLKNKTFSFDLGSEDWKLYIEAEEIAEEENPINAFIASLPYEPPVYYQETGYKGHLFGYDHAYQMDIKYLEEFYIPYLKKYQI